MLISPASSYKCIMLTIQTFVYSLSHDNEYFSWWEIHFIFIPPHKKGPTCSNPQPLLSEGCVWMWGSLHICFVLSLHNSINSTTIFKHFAELSWRSSHQGLVCGQSAWIWMWSSIRPLVIFILRHGNHSYSRMQPDRFWSGVLKRKLHKFVLSRGFPLIEPDGWVGECWISHTGNTKNNNRRNKKS